MTQQQFLEEIKQLSLAERLALIEALFRSLREDLEMSDRNAAILSAEPPEATIQNERERRLAAVRRLRGVLKTSENPPSDEELEDALSEEILRLTEDLQSCGGHVLSGTSKSEQTNVEGSGESKVLLSQRLYGILKFDGDPPGDDELKDAYADYLQEKYS